MRKSYSLITEYNTKLYLIAYQHSEFILTYIWYQTISHDLMYIYYQLS